MATKETVTMTLEHFNKMRKNARRKGIRDIQARHHTYGHSKMPLVTVNWEDYQVYYRAMPR